MLVTRRVRNSKVLKMTELDRVFVKFTLTCSVFSLSLNLVFPLFFDFTPKAVMLLNSQNEPTRFE